MATNQEQEETINETVENKPTEMGDNRKNSKFQVYGFVAGVVLLLIFLIYSFFNSFEKTKEPEKVREVKTKEKKFDFKPAVKEFVPPSTIKAAEEVELKKLTFLEELEVIKKVNKYTSRVIKGTSKTLVKDIQNNKNYESEKAHNDSIFTPKDSNTDYQGDVYSPKVAKVSRFNPNLLLSKGSYIGCSLNTRFVSTIKGGIACTVSNNIYSSNGNTLLIEKGSRLHGSFKGGKLNDGMSRYFIIWEEVRTLNNLVIPLYSGATDKLGASGISGEVDHHWLLRFGSAVLLSAVDDVFRVLSSNLSRGESNEDLTESSRENAKSMASIALESFINIKPTLYKNHGDIVGAYVNRDIDFSKVYKLRVK